MDILKAILYGIVEGITEWLPVSSTGHMILLDQICKIKQGNAFWQMFLVVIQFGAILAVIFMYWKTIWPLGRSKKTGKLMWKRHTLNLWGKTIVACIPAGIVGVLLDDWLDNHLYNALVVSIMLILVGIAFLLVENQREKHDMRANVNRLSELSYKDAFIIGLFQLVAACLPGTSRSGSTILGGIMIGVSRKTAADFTFVLAIPVMAGASLLKIVKFFHAGNVLTGYQTAILLTGCIVAFLVSIFIIRFLMSYIKKHDFKVFGWYRIALGIFVILAFLISGQNIIAIQ
ncbi:undecaprenyl-diphosphate phosphatase [Lachnospiraceae bacterium YH-ros2226]